MANVQAQFGDDYRRNALRRSRTRYRSGLLATLVFILAEALLAIVLVIGGIALFAKLKLASQTSIDLRVTAPLVDPQSDRSTRQVAVPSPERRLEPVPPPADAPSAPVDLAGVVLADATAAMGNGVPVRFDAQVVPPPAKEIPAEAPPSRDLHLETAPPPAPVERAEASPVAIAPPSSEPVPAPEATIDASPPTRAIAERSDTTASIRDPEPVVAGAPPATTSAKPAHPHRVTRPRPRVRAAARRPRAQPARPQTFPVATPLPGQTIFSNRTTSTFSPF